jgi:hypothetical protein
MRAMSVPLEPTMHPRPSLHRSLTRTDLERLFGLDDLTNPDAFNGNLTLRDDGVWRREFPDLHLHPLLGLEERLAMLGQRQGCLLPLPCRIDDLLALIEEEDLDLLVDDNVLEELQGGMALKAALSRPVPVARQQEDEILRWLREHGYDPQALPAPPQGRACPIKGDVTRAMRFSRASVAKAWQRLRSDGRLGACPEFCVRGIA